MGQEHRQTEPWSMAQIEQGQEYILDTYGEPADHTVTLAMFDELDTALRYGDREQRAEQPGDGGERREP